jgi:hypothetical protein
VLSSNGDARRDRWLLVLSGTRNALLLLVFLLVVSFFRSDLAAVFLRRTSIAVAVAAIIFGLLWLIWQRSGMAVYQRQVAARIRQGAQTSYNFRAAVNGLTAFVFTLVGSIVIGVYAADALGL